MSLRVLDDDRPGYALLLFSAQLAQSQLSLSIRSLRENAFLGPDGKWQRAAHYFVADRAGDSARGTEYRVGPEIVNHLLEHDQIAVASEDGALREEALWENAVPQLPGSGSGHSIYRPPPAKVVGSEPASPKFGLMAAPEPASEQPAPAAPPQPESAPQPPQAVARPEPAPKPKADAVTPPKRPTDWLKIAAFGAIPLILIVLFAVPQSRCSLFGMSCPAPIPTPSPRPSEDVLTPAMACAAERERANPCDVKACFTAYLAATPPREIAPKATAVINTAEQDCRVQQATTAEYDVLQKARECARRAAACSAKGCYDSYMSQYERAGRYRSDARTEIASAAARCPPPSPRAMADGTYNAASLRGCGTAAEQGIHVTVSGNTISWQHELKGTRYNWTGYVDADGNIRASAGSSLDASGRYSDSVRDIQMQYPQCGSEAIILTIIGRL